MAYPRSANQSEPQPAFEVGVPDWQSLSSAIAQGRALRSWRVCHPLAAEAAQGCTAQNTPSTPSRLRGKPVSP